MRMPLKSLLISLKRLEKCKATRRNNWQNKFEECLRIKFSVTEPRVDFWASKTASRKNVCWNLKKPLWHSRTCWNLTSCVVLSLPVTRQEILQIELIIPTWQNVLVHFCGLSFQISEVRECWRVRLGNEACFWSVHLWSLPFDSFDKSSPIIWVSSSENS